MISGFSLKTQEELKTYVYILSDTEGNIFYIGKVQGIVCLIILNKMVIAP